MPEPTINPHDSDGPVGPEACSYCGDVWPCAAAPDYIQLQDCGRFHVESGCKGEQDPTEPRMVVRSVPASIPRSRVFDFIESLGINAGMVTGGAGIVIGWDAIRCRVLAQDDNGDPYVDTTGTSLAIHDICIPIVEDRT